jgi:hypothetical protein
VNIPLNQNDWRLSAESQPAPVQISSGWDLDPVPFGDSTCGPWYHLQSSILLSHGQGVFLNPPRRFCAAVSGNSTLVRTILHLVSITRGARVLRHCRCCGVHQITFPELHICAPEVTGTHLPPSQGTTLGQWELVLPRDTWGEFAHTPSFLEGHLATD